MVVARGAPPQGRRPRGLADRMDLAEPLALLPGLVVQGVGKVARFDDARAVPVGDAHPPREGDGLPRPGQAQDAMLEKLLVDCSQVPAADLIDSESLKLREVGRRSPSPA